MLNVSNIALYIGVINLFIHNKFIFETFEQNNLQKNVLLSSFVPFFPLLILIGGSIILTLSYVSWRKYKGTEYEKKMQKKRNRNN